MLRAQDGVVSKTLKILCHRSGAPAAAGLDPVGDTEAILESDGSQVLPEPGHILWAWSMSVVFTPPRTAEWWGCGQICLGQPVTQLPEAFWTPVFSSVNR